MVIAGHVCLDEIVTPEGVVRAAGSPAVFMAPVLAEAGMAPVVAAPRGADFEALHTGLQFLEPAVGDQTLVYVNDVRSARRVQWVRHAEAVEQAALGVSTRAALADAEALVLTPLLPMSPELIAEFASPLPLDALRVALVQGYLRGLGPAVRGARPVEPREFAEAPAVLSQVDIAVLSEEDLGDPAASHQAARMWTLAHPSTAVVVTRGAEGASAYLRGERHDVAAHAVGDLPAASLIGAGDLFSAALVVSLLSGRARAGADGPRSSRDRARDPATLTSAVAEANRVTAERLAAR
ncbi:hypothetical protein B5808_15840 [Cnuibacter physcomitrellae]|uniref:Carbohydrate kinase PfkB domain-containing protein n=1 Tax=Cnuibacter physcomitrellae TaxID=1619308 RepID=A0A1X9LMS9_9MICO|nr:hypothetical protein B5808_15840 [Cnuibacter physcomitrellae]